MNQDLTKEQQVEERLDRVYKILSKKVTSILEYLKEKHPDWEGSSELNEEKFKSDRRKRIENLGRDLREWVVVGQFIQVSYQSVKVQPHFEFIFEFDSLMGVGLNSNGMRPRIFKKFDKQNLEKKVEQFIHELVEKTTTRIENEKREKEQLENLQSKFSGLFERIGEKFNKKSIRAGYTGLNLSGYGDNGNEEIDLSISMSNGIRLSITLPETLKWTWLFSSVLVSEVSLSRYTNSYTLGVRFNCRDDSEITNCLNQIYNSL